MPAREPQLLGTLVRPARQRMGWTQDQLASRLGIDKGYISAIEIGARRWPLEHVEALAEALGLDLMEMAIAAGMLPEHVRQRRTVEDAFPPDDPAREIVALLTGMGMDQREDVLSYTQFLISTREGKAPARIDAKVKRLSS